MNRKNKSLKGFIVLGIIMLTTASCGNDDGLSFAQANLLKIENDRKKELLIGTWELTEVDGEILTDIEFSINFRENGKYEESIIEFKDEFSFEGTWEWNSDFSKVLIEYDDGDEAVLNILELDANQLVIQSDGDKYTFERVE